MQAFIKDDRLIVNTMILDNEKEKLLDFIEMAETSGVSAETLFNIEGDKSGIAFGPQDGRYKDTSDATATAENISKGYTAYARGQKITGTLQPALNLNTGIKFRNSTFTEIPNDLLALGNWDEVTELVSTFSFCSSLTRVELDLINLENIENCFEYDGKLEEVILNISSKPINFWSTFYVCSSLTNVEFNIIPKVSNFSNTFAGCSKIETIPQFDTSQCDRFSTTFKGCTKLKNLPVFDLSKAHGSYTGDFVSNCPSLTDESLNNILLSMGTSNFQSNHKKLKYIGLSEEQAQRCLNLPAWNDLEAKGWITGY